MGPKILRKGVGGVPDLEASRTALENHQKVNPVTIPLKTINRTPQSLPGLPKQVPRPPRELPNRGWFKSVGPCKNLIIRVRIACGTLLESNILHQTNSKNPLRYCLQSRRPKTTKQNTKWWSEGAARVPKIHPKPQKKLTMVPMGAPRAFRDASEMFLTLKIEPQHSKMDTWRPQAL